MAPPPRHHHHHHFLPMATTTAFVLSFACLALATPQTYNNQGNQGLLGQGTLGQGNLIQGNLGQGNLIHGNLGQGNLIQGNLGQGNIAGHSNLGQTSFGGNGQELSFSNPSTFGQTSGGGGLLQPTGLSGPLNGLYGTPDDSAIVAAGGGGQCQQNLQISVVTSTRLVPTTLISTRTRAIPTYRLQGDHADQHLPDDHRQEGGHYVSGPAGGADADAAPDGNQIRDPRPHHHRHPVPDADADPAGDSHGYQHAVTDLDDDEGPGHHHDCAE
ncbi:PPE family protein PPE10-like [Penaeus chinensis]|uniref:PPE family protein PPE10-like n=1 Tax=Penaeus chinensis TaxID=139456 RepID=UPI001FB6B4DA|nr:PPE family protein PPE10-like [Penaeus chinensis]